MYNTTFHHQIWRVLFAFSNQVARDRHPLPAANVARETAETATSCGADLGARGEGERMRGEEEHRDHHPCGGAEEVVARDACGAGGGVASSHRRSGWVVDWARFSGGCAALGCE